MRKSCVQGTSIVRRAVSDLMPVKTGRVRPVACSCAFLLSLTLLITPALGWPTGSLPPSQLGGASVSPGNSNSNGGTSDRPRRPYSGRRPWRRPGQNVQRPNQVSQTTPSPSDDSQDDGGLPVVAAAVCQEIPFGDVTGDGRVDVDDTLAVIDAYAGLFDKVPFEFADIAPCPNGDDRIDNSDVLAVNTAFGGGLGSGCARTRCKPCDGNLPPVASAGPDREVWPDEPVAFDARGPQGSPTRDPDGRIVSYHWAFGDDGEASGSDGLPSAPNYHEYQVPDMYEAVLTVTDSCAATRQDRVNVRVCSDVPPQANGGANRTAEINTVVTFDASASMLFNGVNSQDQFYWSFGDGTSSNWQNNPRADHTYAQAGTFTAQLWVKDYCGNRYVQSAPDSVSVTIEDNRPDVPVLDPELVGFVRGYPGTAKGLSLSADGRRLFLASLELAAVEVDVSDPTDPTVVRTATDFSQSSCGVASNGTYLLIGGNGATMALVRFARVTQFGTPAETWTSLGFASQDAAFVGSRAVVAAGGAGLKVIDLAIANAPVLSLPMFARGIALSPDGRIAYVAAGSGANGGLKIVDLSASSLRLLGMLAPAGISNSSDVAVDHVNKVAYVADYSGGLTVIDVRDLANPVRLRSVSTPGSATRLALSGNLLAVASASSLSGTLQFFDVTNATNPVLRGAASGYFSDVVLRNGIAYAAASGLIIIDVGNPSSPAVLGVLRSPLEQSYTACASNGRIALVGGSLTSTTVVDVTTNDATPDPVVLAQIPAAAQSIRIRGSRAYLADGPRGLRVADLSIPSQPVLSTAPDAMFAKGIEFSSDGRTAYVAAGSVGGYGRINVVDISGPTPILRRSIATAAGGDASDIALNAAGTTAFVADSNAGLQVIDLASGSRIGNGFSTGHRAARVRVMGNVAIVATGGSYTASLLFVDVSDLSLPYELARIPGVYTTTFDTFGEYLLLPTYRGLSILDLSDPRSPVETAAVATPGGAASAVRSDDMVFLGNSATLLSIVDLTP